MATIKVPGVGPVKSTYVYLGAAVTVGILAVAYYRRARAGGESVTGVTDSADEGADDPYAQYSDALGYNTVFPSAYGGGQQFAEYGYDVYGNPLPRPTGATGAGGTFVSNQDWAGAAVDELEKTGVTEAVASTAVARVLGGLTVTTDQQSMFLQAVGLLGAPPQGYPAIKLVDSAAQPKPPPARPAGKSLPAPGGLRATSTGQSSVTLDWSPVSGAAGYAVFGVIDPSGGGTPAGKRLMTVTYSGTTVRGLRKGTRYRFDIHAVGHDGGLGARARTFAYTRR